MNERAGFYFLKFIGSRESTLFLKIIVVVVVVLMNLVSLDEYIVSVTQCVKSY